MHLRRPHRTVSVCPKGDPKDGIRDGQACLRCTGTAVYLSPKPFANWGVNTLIPHSYIVPADTYTATEFDARMNVRTLSSVMLCCSAFVGHLGYCFQLCPSSRDRGP